MTQYLTPEQVLFIHNRIINETGGEHGLHDLNMLLSALGRPRATFDGNDLYPDIFRKSAALMDSLTRNHPFLDGNKRTAITAVAIFLSFNGLQLTAENEALVSFTMACTQAQLSLDEICSWVQQHTLKNATD